METEIDFFNEEIDDEEDRNSFEELNEIYIEIDAIYKDSIMEMDSLTKEMANLSNQKTLLLDLIRDNVIKNISDSFSIELFSNFGGKEIIWGDRFKKFSEGMLKPGVRDASQKMVCSYIGIMIHNFAVSAFDILRFIYEERDNYSCKEKIKIFKTEITKVISEMKNMWKNIIKGSVFDGVVEFLNRLLIFTVNVYLTTLKNIIQMIKTGFSAICNAVKEICINPNGLSEDDKNYKALEIIVAGLITTLSLGLPNLAGPLNSIPIMQIPILVQGENTSLGIIVSKVLSALAGAIIASVIVYYMEKSRKNSKDEKLHFKIITNENVRSQCEIANNFFALLFGYSTLSKAKSDTERKLNNIKEEIRRSSQVTDEEIKEFSELIANIRNRRL